MEYTIIPHIINKIISMNNANPIAIRKDNGKKMKDWDTYFYFDFIENINRISRILLQFNCKSIGILSKNNPEISFITLGAINAGIEVIFFNPCEHIKDIKKQIQSSNVKIMFVEDETEAIKLIYYLKKKQIDKIIIIHNHKKTLIHSKLLYYELFLEKDDIQNQFKIIQLQKKMNLSDICLSFFNKDKKTSYTQVDLIDLTNYINLKWYPNYKKNNEIKILANIPCYLLEGFIINILVPIMAASDGKYINVNYYKPIQNNFEEVISFLNIIHPNIFWGCNDFWNNLKHLMQTKQIINKKLFYWLNINKIKFAYGIHKCSSFFCSKNIILNNISKEMNINIYPI